MPDMILPSDEMPISLPKPPKTKGKRKPDAPKSKRSRTIGRPTYVPTKEARQMVTVFRSIGLPIADIAQQLGIDQRTLYKHFRVEMEHGKATIVSRVGAQIVKKALAGDLRAAEFYLKNHGGEAWKDKQRLEHTAAGGGPLLPPNLVVTFLSAKAADADASA